MVERPGLRAAARRLETTFAGRCLREFVALQGIDRAVVLASQAFTALIPLLLLLYSVPPGGHGDVVGQALVDRFHLRGDAAEAVEQLFAHSGSSSIGVFSAFLLLFSGMSLTRRMQRMYQQAWRLPPIAGVGRALYAVLGLTVLVLGIGLLYAVRALTASLALGDVLILPASVVASSFVWVAVPWLLLDRRVAWRRLVPAGVLTAAITAAYGVASIVYVPRLMETYSRRYGLFGVTLALVGWLLCIAVILVAATAVAAELDRAPDGWARRVRRTLRIEPAPETPPPTETRQPAVSGPGQPGPRSPSRPDDEVGSAPPTDGRMAAGSPAANGT
jgi:membrane protein